MRENPVKAILKSGKTAVGVGINIAPNPLVVKVLANAGYDFLFIDTEHNAHLPRKPGGHRADGPLLRHLAPSSAPPTTSTTSSPMPWTRAPMA